MLRNKEKGMLRNKKNTHSGINFEKSMLRNKGRSTPRNKEKKQAQKYREKKTHSGIKKKSKLRNKSSIVLTTAAVIGCFFAVISLFVYMLH